MQLGFLDGCQVHISTIEVCKYTNVYVAPFFKNSNLQNNLTNKINVVLGKIDQGLYQEALNKLEHDILAKTNGCAEIGEPDRNDWITDCVSQSQVYALIMEAIELLNRLIP